MFVQKKKTFYYFICYFNLGLIILLVYVSVEKCEMCSHGEQIRYVRHKRHLISIRNLLSRLPPGYYMSSVGISAWTGLDPRGVTCERDSDAQVSKELSKSQIS